MRYRRGTPGAARACHAARMDLNSWTPDDNARRFATLIATASAVFTFLALWMGAALHPLLALLLAAVDAVIVWLVARAALRVYFRR